MQLLTHSHIQTYAVTKTRTVQYIKGIKEISSNKYK